jgi:CheY-like chemotaxis protein
MRSPWVAAINPRIPIVDDDENVLEIATTLIRRFGYTALIASNGGGAQTFNKARTGS